MRAAHERQAFATVLLFMVILGAGAVTNVAAGQRGGRGGRGAQGGGGGQTQADTTTGFVITQRRTRPEWELLVATHRGLYPDADFQAFRRGGPSPTDSAPQPHPMDAAIAHLARTFPLRTPEWAAWSATMRPPHLESTWILSGTEAGRGAFFGR